VAHSVALRRMSMSLDKPWKHQAVSPTMLCEKVPPGRLYILTCYALRVLDVKHDVSICGDGFLWKDNGGLVSNSPVDCLVIR
jgi:hypothetical protein